MKIVRVFFRGIYNVYAGVIFLSILLLLFPIILSSVFLNKNKRGNFIYNISRFAIDMLFLFWGMPHQNIFEYPHDPAQPVIFVFNHISYLDALVIVKSIRKQHFRGLGKFEASKIPVLGFIYKSAVITVKRSDAADRARSLVDLKNAISQNISIALAPEGTFNETDEPLIRFYDGAFKIAIETQTPIKPILFLDTFDRMSYKNYFPLTPGSSRTVFLQEISVKGLTMEDLPFLKETVYSIMEKSLIKYQANWIKNITVE